jgi:hypothetical protein
MPSRWYDGAENRASGSASGIESESCDLVLLVEGRTTQKTYKVYHFPPWAVGDRCRLDMIAFALSFVLHLTFDSHQLGSQHCKLCAYGIIVRRRLGWKVVLFISSSQSPIGLYLRLEQAIHIHIPSASSTST